MKKERRFACKTSFFFALKMAKKRQKVSKNKCVLEVWKNRMCRKALYFKAFQRFLCDTAVGYMVW